MRRTTTGSAAPMSAATTMATPTARAVSSRCGLTGVSVPGGGLSVCKCLASLMLSVSEDAGENPIELGERVVADLDGPLPVRVLQFDLRAQLALKLFHQVAHLHALSGFTLFPGKPFRLEPLDERLDCPHREALGDDF